MFFSALSAVITTFDHPLTPGQNHKSILGTDALHKFALWAPGGPEGRRSYVRYPWGRWVAGVLGVTVEEVPEGGVESIHLLEHQSVPGLEGDEFCVRDGFRYLFRSEVGNHHVHLAAEDQRRA